MHCIVGLGNPGKKYAKTRHNVGFVLIDHLAEYFQIPLIQKKWNSLTGKGYAGEKEVLLVQPLTYMNRSGTAVVQIVQFYKISLQNLLVIHDDMDLPPGQIRIVRGGGAGGHKGVASIIEALGTQGFPRLKIGIGRPPPLQEPEHYVLETFSREEIPVIEQTIKRAEEASETIIEKGIDTAMNRFNIKRPLNL